MRQSSSTLGKNLESSDLQSPGPDSRGLIRGLAVGLGMCASLAGAQCPGGGTAPSTLASENFENEDANCWSSSNSGCGQFRAITSGLSISTTTARGTKSLKVSHPANETYSHADFSIRPTDTLIYRAYYYFPTGYDFALGQKVARFFAKGDDDNVYQNVYLQIVSAGGAGAQCGTTESGSIGIYNQTGPGFSPVTGSVSFTRGQWYAIKVQLLYNTGSSNNGSITVWVNGNQVAQATGLNLRGTIPTSIKWSDVQVGGGYSNGGGGANSCPNPNQHADYYIDDIEIGTNNDVVYPGPNNKVLLFHSTLETESASCWNPGGAWRSACGSFRGIAPVMTLETASGYGGSSKSLKVHHTANETYGHATISFPATDTLWYSAQYRFASGFDYGQGMKIARFQTYNGTALANDMVLQIQSASGDQCLVNPAGQIGIYHNCNPGTGSCAANTGFSPVTSGVSGLTLTNWNNIKVRLIYNKTNQSDGSVTLWVNGTQLVTRTGMTLRGALPSTVKFNQIYTGGWYSNSANNNSCPNPVGSNTYYHIDDIKVAAVDPD